MPTSRPAFLRRPRAAGHDADLVDPLTDDITDARSKAPYDGVWGSAPLLHVRQEDLPQVLAELAAGWVATWAQRDGGPRLDMWLLVRTSRR